ncbi:MAG: hypothetical protein J6W75_08080 [Bacteroidaceae bacterium]|nr:hypothetical protein [Bacteroidaceae bacterium]
MKKLMFMCLMALACVGFTACGSDDDDNGGGGGNNNGFTKYEKAEVTETSNQLILTYSESVGDLFINVKWTCDFKDNECTSSKMEFTYPSEKLAQEEYQDLVDAKDEDDTNLYSIKGNVVTIDNSAEFKGYNKEVMKYVMEATAEEFNKKNK